MCLLGACATLPNQPAAVAYQRELPIGVELAAALAASTVRGELPFADPVPQAAAAPCSRLAADTFVLRYEQRRDGQWLPLATHRLLVVMPRAVQAGSPPRVETRAALGMPGFGSEATTIVELKFVGGPTRCTVVGSLPAGPGHDWARTFDRKWDLAAAPTALAPGLIDGNLRAFVAHRLVAEAARQQAAGDRHGASSLLLQATALGAEAPAILLAIGTSNPLGSDPGAAAERLWQTALASDDPTLRQHAVTLAATLAAPADGANRLRLAAAQQLAAADLDGAQTTLHSARRAEPRPSADYRMQRELHRLAGDHLAALACALLAREHSEAQVNPRSLRADLAAAGMGELARRLATAPSYEALFDPLHGAAPANAHRLAALPVTPTPAPVVR